MQRDTPSLTIEGVTDETGCDVMATPTPRAPGWADAEVAVEPVGTAVTQVARVALPARQAVQVPVH